MFHVINTKFNDLLGKFQSFEDATDKSNDQKQPLETTTILPDINGGEDHIMNIALSNDPQTNKEIKSYFDSFLEGAIAGL